MVKSQFSPKLPKETNIHLLAEDQTRITRRSESSEVEALKPQENYTFLLMWNMEEITDYTLEKVKSLRQYAWAVKRDEQRGRKEELGLSERGKNRGIKLKTSGWKLK